jgi:hypothetical protein
VTTAFLIAAAAVVSVAAQPAPDVRARLAAYEAQTAASGRPDPPALAAIARDVVAAARRAATFRVWSEACAVTTVPDSDRCAARLGAALDNTGGALATRAEAAAALMARGDKDAAEKLFQILAPTRVSALAPLAPIVALLPPRRAVPILTRLAESESKSDQSASCTALSGIDTAESRAAIARVVEGNAPGSEPWLLCMIARARLRDAISPAAVWGYGHALQGDNQLFAVRVMVEMNHPSVEQVLTDLTRRGSTAERLGAADLLAPIAPDSAIPVIEAAEADADAGVRTVALGAERRLKRPPTKTVRAMLGDPSELVRIAAAEDVIDWASREQIH